MIYTVTLNPSVDFFVEMDELVLGGLNRIEFDYKVPGGKAINVSRTLHQMGLPSVATGFIGGYTGKYVRDELAHAGIASDFVEIQDETRINIKLNVNGKETTINSKGPKVSPMELNDFLYYMSRVGEGDFVVIGGSLPQGAPDNFYGRLVDICLANGANFLLDFSTDNLKTLLTKGPLLAKVQQDDIPTIFGEVVANEQELLHYGLSMIELGVKNLIIPMEESGAILFTEDKEVYRYYGLEGEVVNTVASRDAMLAGFIGGYMRTTDPLESFRVACAAGSASIFAGAIPTKEQISELMDRVVIERIS